MKLTFKPTEKYKGERTGLVVMGLDYAGLIPKYGQRPGIVSSVLPQSRQRYFRNRKRYSRFKG